jgi:hypothetical protein
MIYLPNVLGGDVFDLAQLRICDGGFVGEVKPQFFGGHKRTFLVHPISENFAKRIIENMRTGVVVLNRNPTKL